jgi:hypothetical protein
MPVPPVAICMIGDMVCELTGKMVGQRLEHHYGGEVKLERTIEANGKVFGEEVTFLVTTWAMERPQGGMFMKGHGIIMTKKGEKAMLQGLGITLSKAGPIGSIRGVRYLQTLHPCFHG